MEALAPLAFRFLDVPWTKSDDVAFLVGTTTSEEAPAAMADEEGPAVAEGEVSRTRAVDGLPLVRFLKNGTSGSVDVEASAMLILVAGEVVNLVVKIRLR